MEVSGRMLGVGALAIALLLAAGAAYFGRGMGDGRVHVIGPVAGAVNIDLDGVHVNAVAPREAHAFTLTQGEHDLRLAPVGAPAREHHLTVDDGSYDRVAPMTDQCFVNLDVTEVYYGSAPRPLLVGRHFEGEPFDVGASQYFSEHGLPQSISRGAHTNLLVEVPCSMSSASEQALIDAAGYSANAPPRPRL
ncbi:MAG: hypothetical protein AB7S26_09170 [Sandaracinaceae bacterium]